MTVEADQVHDAWNLQHMDAVTQRKKDKHVPGKQRCVESHAPILPASHRFVRWEKMVDATLDELRGSCLLVVCTRVRSIPVRLGILRWRIPGTFCGRRACTSAYHFNHQSNVERQLRSVAYRAKRPLTLCITNSYNNIRETAGGEFIHPHRATWRGGTGSTSAPPRSGLCLRINPVSLRVAAR